MLVSLESDRQQLAYEDTEGDLPQSQSLIILIVTDVPALANMKPRPVLRTG